MDTAPQMAKTNSACSDFEHLVSGIIAMDDSVCEEFSTPVVSHEFRLILKLLINKQMIIKEAALSSKLSHRAFHTMVKKLEHDRILLVEQNSDDMRSKTITLNCNFVHAIRQNLEMIGSS